MTESEKAAAGFLYDANYDEELARQRAECKDKCHRYNLCLPSDTAQQDEIMRGILGKAGNGLHITAPFWCDYGYNIFVGDDFYSNHNLVILDCAPITFGNHVFIAPNCCFSAAGTAARRQCPAVPLFPLLDCGSGDGYVIEFWIWKLFLQCSR